MTGLLQLLFAAAPSLNRPPEASEYIILSLGVFLGNIAMGICGFGTAIIHLSVWVLAQALGYNSGPLPKAVIACSCAMTIGMVPMFFLAKARQHAIKPLAISIPIAKGLAAPFGALVLKLLPARQLEAVVSVLMVIMILLINKQKLQGAALYLHKCRSTLNIDEADTPDRKMRQNDYIKGAESQDELREALLAADRAADRLASTEYVPASHQSAAGNMLDGTSSGTEDDTDSADSLDSREDSSTPLTDARVHQAADVIVHVHDLDGAVSNTSDTGVDSTGEPSYKKYGSFWGLFAIGSVTGLCTGILGGATGINGPPLMLLYACLQASKDAVRGTNAVMSLVQDQWIGYYVFGLLQWADRYLYLSAAVAGASGMLIGNSVQKLMDQRHFNFVMSMLMATCCTLMLCAAAGLINLASE